MSTWHIVYHLNNRLSSIAVCVSNDLNYKNECTGQDLVHTRDTRRVWTRRDLKNDATPMFESTKLTRMVSRLTESTMTWWATQCTLPYPTQNSTWWSQMSILSDMTSQMYICMYVRIMYVCMYVNRRHIYKYCNCYMGKVPGYPWKFVYLP